MPAFQRRLAFRTEEGIVAQNPHPAYRGSADRAGLPPAVAYLEMTTHLDIDWLGSPLDLLNTPLKDRAHTAVQPIDILFRQLVAACLGMDAGDEKDFICIRVSNGAEILLVHEKNAYLLAASFQRLFEDLQCEIL